MNADLLIHQIFSGLASGGIYASVALALVMIYQATHHVNFAQGELAMFSTYIAWSLMQTGMPYWGAFFLTVAIAFVLGVVIERVIVRPVENAPILSVVIVFIGYKPQYAHVGITPRIRGGTSHALRIEFPQIQLHGVFDELTRRMKQIRFQAVLPQLVLVDELRD